MATEQTSAVCPDCGERLEGARAVCGACGFCGVCGRTQDAWVERPGRFTSCPGCYFPPESDADLGGRLAVAAMAAAGLLALVAAFLYRDLVSDESQYLIAASLVLSGELPYADFFFPQMPLLPYLYAPAIAVLGDEVLAGRLVSVLFVLGSATALGAALFVVTSRRLLGLAGGSLLLLCNYFVLWNVVVQHFAPTSFFLASGFLSVVVALKRAPRGGERWPLVAAGILLGAAAAVRLNAWFVVVVAALLIPYWLQGQRDRGGAPWRWGPPSGAGRTVLPYALGVSIPTAVTVGFALLDPSAFLLDTVGVHLTHGDAGSVVATLQDHLLLVPRLLLDPQVVVLLLASCAAVLQLLVNRSAAAQEDPSEVGGLVRGSQLVAGAFAAAIVASYELLPGLLSGMYLSVMMPFLVFLAVSLVAGRSLTPRSVFIASPLLGVGLVMYVSFFAIEQFTPTFSDTRQRASVESTAPLKTLFGDRRAPWQRIEELAYGLCRATTPDTRLAAYNPLFVFLSGRPYVPGFEMGEWADTFARERGLTPGEMGRYHLLTRQELFSRMGGSQAMAIWGDVPSVGEASGDPGFDREISVGLPLHLTLAAGRGPEVGKGCDG